MTQLKALLRALYLLRWHIACALAIGLFAWTFSRFHRTDQGFTFALTIGDKWKDRLIPEMKSMDVYLHPNSWGYDAVSYAQIAMVPDLHDPELAAGLDNLSYRARRILFCWTAWLAGGGDPGRALHAFTLQNAFAWILLAFLLFRWLPPVSLWNFVRWFAILFSFGLSFSVRSSLVDGPSLLLIASGIALAEMGRPWLSALVLGVSGLGKETNIGAAVAMDLPARITWRETLPWLARGAIVVLPLFLWLGYLSLTFSSGNAAGSRNFDLPLAGFVTKCRETFGTLVSGRTDVGLSNLFVLVSLTTQLLFFALRPRWRDRWWRLGALMSLLMLVLGDAVWEGHPCASARVLLPMLLAFNLMLPRGWWWALVFVLGNVSILGSPYLLKPAPARDFRVEGPAVLRGAPGVGAVSVLFEPGWHDVERSHLEYWRWSSGSAGIVFKNPHAFPIVARVEFDLRSRESRETRIETDGRFLWSGTITDDQQNLDFEVTLLPGETRWWFKTTMPAGIAGATDGRLIAFSLRNFKVRLIRPAEGPPHG